MWQLYAQTAFDIVAERQREARQAVTNSRADARPDGERDRAHGFGARVVKALGLALGSIAESSRSLPAKLEGDRGNA